MVLKVNVVLSMVLYNKNNMEPLKIEKKITKRWEEKSEEYKELCARYRETIGYERGNTIQEKDRYDKKVLELAAKEVTENMLETVDIIENVVRQCYTQKTGAFVEYAGYIINPADFCAIKVMEPVVDVKKE